MFKATQKTLRTLILFFAGFFMMVSLLVIWFWFGIHVSKEHDSGLAFWLPHDFSSGEQDPSILMNQLDGLPVTDLYFHVGPIESDGSLAKDLQISSSVLEALPSTNYAWIGQVRSEIDLSNPAVREKIKDSAAWLLEQGFDGIHVDIEPVHEDDTDFLLLLQELDTALPEASLSVAMDEWQPHGLTQLIAAHFNVSAESYWSTTQVQNVLPFIDQLVVMTYDTGFHDPALYSWWVEQETLALSKRVNPDVELFIGIPCYSEGAQFDPLSENVDSALKGYERGVENLRSDAERITGLAVYPYWEMDETEWTSLRNFFQDDETDPAQ